MVSRDEVIAVYRTILGREPENETVIKNFMAKSENLIAMASAAVQSPEFAARIRRPPSFGQGIIGGRHYEIVRPGATYAPWRSDSQFLQTREAISKNTLVDLYRCWNLWQLIAQVAKRCGPNAHFIEIGVWRGGTGMLMARRMAMLGLPQPIYLCDTFAGVVKAGDHDPHYAGGEHADTSVAVVHELAMRLSIKNYELCVGVFPDRISESLSAGPVTFCHIDVDAYASARDCFAYIWPRMVVGGIVVFDDCGFSSTSGVAKLVEELSERADGLSQYNLNGQGLVLKLPG